MNFIQKARTATKKVEKLKTDAQQKKSDVVKIQIDFQERKSIKI